MRDVRLGDFFDAVAAHWGGSGERVVLASNYIANDLVNLLRDDTVRDSEMRPEITISAEYFGKIINMLADGTVSSRSGKDILAAAIESGEDPEKIAQEKGLLQIRDTDQLAAIVDAVIQANTSVVADYKAGKQAALQFLVGQGMKMSRGVANPGALIELFRGRLS